MWKQERRADRRLNVLLSNGRFPVTLDLSRQLRLAGHRVFVADSMHFHICKFSKDVIKSYHVPVPREDAAGFIKGILHAIHASRIDLVIPMHEEIFYLAEAAQTIPELRSKLFAPAFPTLVMLHNKWKFANFLEKHGLHAPRSVLCRSYPDVLALHRETEWALKPTFGRGSTNVFHLKPNEPLPSQEEVGVSEENHYVAQEWKFGQRYCTYSIFQAGHVAATSIYPVQVTIDGSSCVYFKAIEKKEITDFIDKLAAALPGVSGQIALDLVECSQPQRLFAIECNPRATSGIHLYSGTSRLALALTCRVPIDAPNAGHIPDHIPAPTRAKCKVAPGMLMWKRSSSEGQCTVDILRDYMNHMKRLVLSRDVIWSWKDLTPSLMQPFLLTSYYEICREKGLKLPTMFQYDLVWEPRGEHLESVRRVLEKEEEDSEKQSQADSQNSLLTNLSLDLAVLSEKLLTQ